MKNELFMIIILIKKNISGLVKKRLKKKLMIFLPKFLTSNKNNYLDWFDKS